MERAEQIAKAENKKIMISFYADWCSFCKKMDKETFTDGRVVQQLKKNFVLVRINVESDEHLTFRGKQITGRRLAQLMRASSLPTTSFLDSAADPITYFPGKPDTDIFIDLLSFIASDAYQKTDFETFLKSKN